MVVDNIIVEKNVYFDKCEVDYTREIKIASISDWFCIQESDKAKVSAPEKGLNGVISTVN